MNVVEVIKESAQRGSEEKAATEKFVFFDSLHTELHSASLQDSKRQWDANEMFQHPNAEILEAETG